MYLGIKMAAEKENQEEGDKERVKLPDQDPRSQCCSPQEMGISAL